MPLAHIFCTVANLTLLSFAGRLICNPKTGGAVTSVSSAGATQASASNAPRLSALGHERCPLSALQSRFFVDTHRLVDMLMSPTLNYADRAERLRTNWLLPTTISRGSIWCN